MIETMIIQFKSKLPLLISNISWDGDIFQISGPNWSLCTLSTWRVSSKNTLVFGCYDENSNEQIKKLYNLKIIDIEIQDSSLKIDPVLILSNGLRLEVFTTHLYEPWVFNVDNAGYYVSTPGEPELFTL